MEIKITDKQRQTLAEVSKNTGRTADELISNYLNGWLKSLEIDLLRTNINKELERLKAEKKINSILRVTGTGLNPATVAKKNERVSFLKRIGNFFTG